MVIESDDRAAREQMPVMPDFLRRTALSVNVNNDISGTVIHKVNVSFHRAVTEGYGKIPYGSQHYITDII